MLAPQLVALSGEAVELLGGGTYAAEVTRSRHRGSVVTRGIQSGSACAMRSPSWAERLPHAFPAMMELSLSGMVVTAMQKSLEQSSGYNAHSNFLLALNTPSSENRSFQNGQPLIQHFLCGFCCCFAFVFLFFPFGSGWQGRQKHSALWHWWPSSQFLVWLSLGYPTRPHPV